MSEEILRGKKKKKYVLAYVNNWLSQNAEKYKQSEKIIGYTNARRYFRTLITQETFDAPSWATGLIRSIVIDKLAGRNSIRIAKYMEKNNLHDSLWQAVAYGLDKNSPRRDSETKENVL